MSTPPPVQMLWERVDPEATLLDRFGHDDFEAVARWVEGVLDVHHGIATSPVSLRSLIGAWIEQAPLAAPAAAVALLRRLVEAAPDDAGPRHLVHGDHRAANILVRDGRPRLRGGPHRSPHRRTGAVDRLARHPVPRLGSGGAADQRGAPGWV